MVGDAGRELLQTGNENSKLSSPVTEVVYPRHLVANSPVNIGNKISYHGGSEVSDMERLGNIWRTENRKT